MPLRFDQALPRKSTEKVSILKNFFKRCLSLGNDEDTLAELSDIIEKTQSCLRREKIFNHIHRTMNIGQEIHMNSHIGDYNKDFIFLDLGSNVNVLTRKTWELMGNPWLVWSYVNIILSN